MARTTNKWIIASGMALGSAWLTHGTRSPEERARDLYKESRRLHAAQVEMTKMTWGNPLPFKSEILTNWGPRSARRSAK